MTTPMTPEAASEFARFGAALAGQYELECEIGRGGMGIVYLARDLRLDRRVAIKTLPPHLAGDSVVRERFLREARTAGRLSHPNIVPIHRADELGGHVFFVMGFVDGESMAQRIRARGRIDPREVIRQLSDVADALQYAHEHGIVHRDVKAENILLDGTTGRAMVTDFGIARMAEAAPLTSTGQVLGTVYYLSPEQVSGEPVDSRADIYSLGIVAYLALAGRFPFDAELASAVLIAHVNKRPPALASIAPNVPTVLAEIVDRCLAKNPADRFQTCAELADTLASVSDRVEHEMAHLPTPLVSNTEAHDILARAADLQAQTGIEPRPFIPMTPRDAERDAMLQTGHRLPDLRDAAAEAGIPAKYFDRALAERGLGEQAKSVGVIDHTIRNNVLTGAPTRLEFEVVIDGEMPTDDFDLLLEIIRQAAGESGETSTVGRSFSWQSNPNKGNINISVLTRAGKTRIRATESLKAAAGGLFGGVLGGVGGGAAPIVFGIGAKLHDPLLALGLWVGWAAAVYVGTRAGFKYHARDRETRLRALTERIAAQVRESIDYAKPKLPGRSG